MPKASSKPKKLKAPIEANSLQSTSILTVAPRASGIKVSEEPTTKGIKEKEMKAMSEIQVEPMNEDDKEEESQQQSNESSRNVSEPTSGEEPLFVTKAPASGKSDQVSSEQEGETSASDLRVDEENPRVHSESGSRSSNQQEESAEADESSSSATSPRTADFGTPQFINGRQDRLSRLVTEPISEATAEIVEKARSELGAERIVDEQNRAREQSQSSAEGAILHQISGIAATAKEF